jgi:hypothetical protein
MSLEDNIKKLLDLNRLFLTSLYYSKDKDYTKGNQIINDYAKYHKPTDDDPLIANTREKIRVEQNRLRQIIKHLQQLQ